MGKYRNRKTTVDGILFDSAKEARRYAELKLMQRAGLISYLNRQVRLDLLPVQKYKGKSVERPVYYVADFQYFDNEKKEWIYEDVKGVRTPEYILKRKLVLYFHGIRIKEV